MKKVLFVCHGNICRSPMAEFVMKDIVKKNGLENEFLICSSATSTEEIGSDTHWGTKQILDEMGISYTKRQAVQLKKSDYEANELLKLLINSEGMLSGDGLDKRVIALRLSEYYSYKGEKLQRLSFSYGISNPKAIPLPHKRLCR